MIKDELRGDGNVPASRRYRERTERFIRSSKVEKAEAADLDWADDVARARAAQEDRLLRDEDEARSELPR